MSTAGRKLFVGSLPQGVQDSQLRAEFSRFGQVEDVFIKQGCEAGRQWAFITMGAPDQAQTAKEQCDRILMMAGAERPCDVMVAKNQGMFGQQGEAGAPPGPPPAGVSGIYGGNGQYGLQAGYLEPQQQQFSQTAPVKIFVGSLPDGITDAPLRAEYSKYGSVTDIFVKPNCEPGRQWAFVSFNSPEEATHAKEMTDGILQFPGQLRGCEVTMARNQGLFGKDPITSGPPRHGDPGRGSITDNMMAPKKVFVGSLPANITDAQIQSEFARYGQVIDIHINNKPCEPGRNWAFITYANSDQANLAKTNTDRLLVFPGAEKACEVTLARHQGMFGQEPITAEGAPGVAAGQVGAYADPYGQYAGVPIATAPKKIFVGSLPETVTDGTLRSEFSRYGQVTDVFVSTKPCEPGRNWAFVTFVSPEQAQYAKDCTDRVLVMPGADRACEVMLAKNQGKFGQEPTAAPAAAVQQIYMQPAVQARGYAGPPGHGQPPPPEAPPPSHLTPWRMYKTAAGLPYYHNHASQVTQWECPPELQVPGQTNVYQIPAPPAGAVRYAPY